MVSSLAIRLTSTQMGITSSVTPLTNVQSPSTRLTLAGWLLAGGNLTVCYLTLGKVAMAILPTVASTGPFPVYCRIMCFVAIQKRIPTRQAPSFTSAFLRRFVRTCTARPTAANRGQSFSQTDSRVEATSNGLQLIKQAALGMDSNTSQAMAATVITAALWNSNAPP